MTHFFTVSDTKQARKSVFVATGLIGYFYILSFIIDLGARVVAGQETVISFDKVSIITDAGLAVLLIILIPTIWVVILKNEKATFSFKNRHFFQRLHHFWWV